MFVFMIMSKLCICVVKVRVTGHVLLLYFTKSCVTGQVVMICEWLSVVDTIFDYMMYLFYVNRSFALFFMGYPTC